MNNKRVYSIIWSGEANYRSGLPVVSHVYVIGKSARDDFLRSIRELDPEPIVRVADRSALTF